MAEHFKKGEKYNRRTRGKKANRFIGHHPDTVKEVAELWLNSNMTLGELSSKFNVSKSSPARWGRQIYGKKAKRLNRVVTHVNLRKYDKDTVNMIVIQKRRGFTVEEIANNLSMEEEKVEYILGARGRRVRADSRLREDIEKWRYESAPFNFEAINNRTTALKFLKREDMVNVLKEFKKKIKIDLKKIESITEEVTEKLDTINRAMHNHNWPQHKIVDEIITARNEALEDRPLFELLLPYRARRL